MDLDLIPVQQGNEQLVLIRDPLGLVPEGRALPMQLYEFLALLDGSRSVRDLQMELMRQRGGLLVGSEEVERLLQHLDESLLLQTARYEQARERIVKAFGQETVRPCSHCGQAYPEEVTELRRLLDEILENAAPAPQPEGRVVALMAPHIDLSAGSELYGRAYQCLRNASPSRVVVLGVGHQLANTLFSLTEKDFHTPLGDVRNDRRAVKRLREAGGELVAGDDFAHRSEHSVEFQVLFLQHLLPGHSFALVPILCGSLKPAISPYRRNAYLERAGTFLEELSRLIQEGESDTLVVAGVDFSHIGPKFGHPMPATYLEGQTERHDRALLKAITEGDADAFWAESAQVHDQFNVCGFAALACLLEILPAAQCHVLGYQMWHEAPTRSAVSFAAAVFTAT
jgi:AmmeMemoRadiSam system protein B